jgi:hypothetical protein
MYCLALPQAYAFYCTDRSMVGAWRGLSIALAWIVVPCVRPYLRRKFGIGRKPN